MKSKMKIRVPASMAQRALLIASLVAAPLLTPMAGAQTPQRFVGTITAISGDTLTVKTDQGQAYQVEVPTTAALKRITPGQRSLSEAQTIQFSNLAVGDRALVRLDPNAPAGTSEALQIVAVKQADLSMKQQMEREDWQKRGVGGLVKSVDAATGVIMLTSGAGSMMKTITVHTTPATTLKRYAPGSVSFDEAQPAPVGAIHVGDQLRARGTKNADGTEIAAEDVISGSFRNISGLITSIDMAGSTLVVKDLATKKPVTIHITVDSLMHQLPDRMAQMLAARLKGSAEGGQSGQRNRQGGSSQPAESGGGDLQQMLNRAPAIQLADLKKGDAVMLVSTEGTTNVNAITLLAGVEPLLQSREASQNLLSSWSMDSSSGAGIAAQ